MLFVLLHCLHISLILVLILSLVLTSCSSSGSGSNFSYSSGPCSGLLYCSGCLSFKVTLLFCHSSACSYSSSGYSSCPGSGPRYLTQGSVVVWFGQYLTLVSSVPLLTMSDKNGESCGRDGISVASPFLQRVRQRNQM